MDKVLGGGRSYGHLDIVHSDIRLIKYSKQYASRSMSYYCTRTYPLKPSMYTLSFSSTTGRDSSDFFPSNDIFV